LRDAARLLASAGCTTIVLGGRLNLGVGEKTSYPTIVGNLAKDGNLLRTTGHLDRTARAEYASSGGSRSIRKVSDQLAGF